MKKKNEISYGVIPLKLEEENWYIFLIKHLDGNHWGFPKGKPQGNESPKDTSIRELQEETNLTPVKFLTDEPLKETYHYYRDHQEINKQVYYYPVQVEGNANLQQDEIVDGKWFSFKDAYSRITFDESKFIFSQLQEIMRDIHT